MDWIFSLSGSLDCLDSRLIGNKAYSLAYARSNRFPVPQSLVVSITAFHEFLNSAAEDIHRLLSQWDQNSDRANEILVGIRDRIMEWPLAPSMAGKIYEAFFSLNSKFVAIRSSATTEDGNIQSFAGQYESFLGVTKENLLMCIKACWASLFGVRAFRYLKHGQHYGNMAVLIQEMIDADVSGVCFSINPVTGNDNEIIIEAVRGLGEYLVQGTVVPDHYQVPKETLKVDNGNLHVHIQEDMMILNTHDHGCILNRIEDERIRIQQKVSNDKIREIAGYAVEAERCYRGPVDIEWALKDGRLYFLQVRPITGL